MERERLRWLMHNAWQFGRFAIVGVCNTLVDFGITNLLVLSFHPRSSLGYFLVSFTACALATLNSFFMNQRWTFKTASGEPAQGALGKFYLVAGISLLVNTSTFLFFVRFLPDRLHVSQLAAVNMAKLAGVIVAFSVSFLGYRFGVFRTESVREFRRTFSFDLAGGPSFARQALLVGSVGLAVRLGYLLLAATLSGSGRSCAALANQYAVSGQVPPDNGFSLFCAWEGLLLALGLNPAAAAVCASLLPGVFLLAPVIWVARRLFGPRAAWLAGAFCALHPRLVEFSVNGAPESFTLASLAVAAACLVSLSFDGLAGTALGAGGFFGLAATVGAEWGLAFLFACYGVMRYGAQRGPRAGAWKRSVGCVVLAVAGFLGVMAAYVQLSGRTPPWTGYLRPLTAPASTFAPVGQAGLQSDAPGTAPRRSKTTFAEALDQYPGQFMRQLETLPGVVLTPTVLFALLLPLFMGRRSIYRNARLPLLILLVFPLLYAPFAHPDAGTLLPAVIPLQVFGAAGLLAFTAYTSREVRISGLRQWLAGGILVYSLVVCAWRGLDVRKHHSPEESRPSGGRATLLALRSGGAAPVESERLPQPTPWRKHVAGVGGHTISGDVRVVSGTPGPDPAVPVDLWVLLPDGYDQAAARYPVIYAFGGPAVFDAAAGSGEEWQVDETLTVVQLARKKQAFIAVCWTPTMRPAAWRAAAPEPPGLEAQARFVAERLKPFVDARFRTAPDRLRSVVMGGGREAWAACETWLRYPNLFGRLAALSLRDVPGAQNLAAWTEGVARNRKGARFYLTGQIAEGALNAPVRLDPAQVAAQLGQAAGVERLVGFLGELGFGKKEIQVVDDEGGSGPAAWARRFPEAVLWLIR